MKRLLPLLLLAVLALAPATLLAQSTPMTKYTPQGSPNTYGECCFDLAVSTGVQYPSTGSVSLEITGPSAPYFGSASTSIGGWSTSGVGTPLVTFMGSPTYLALNLDAFTFCVRRAIGPFAIRCRWYDATHTNYYTRDTTFSACWPDTCHTVKFEHGQGCTFWPSFRNHNPKGATIDDFHIAIVAPTSATMSLGSIPPGWADNGSSPAMLRLRAVNPGGAVQLDQLFSQMSFTLNSEPCKSVTIQWWTTSHDTIMKKDSVVCMGRDSLFCCDCVPGEFQRPDTSKCCFTFSIQNRNPLNRPLRRIVFTLPGAAVFSSAGYTGTQGFAASGIGTNALTYSGGPVAISQVASLFDFCIANAPPGPFIIQYTTYDVTPNGQMPLCTFTDTLVCGGCACLHNFQHVAAPANAPDGCNCYYRFTALNPQLVDRVVISGIDAATIFRCGAVPPVTQGGPPTGWTMSGLNSNLLTFNAPATHSAPIPICQAAVFEFGMPAGGAVHWTTYYLDGTVCEGIDTLACDTCTCKAVFTSVAPIPGVPNCACRYEVRVTSPSPTAIVAFDIPSGAAQFGCAAFVSTDLPGWTITNTGTQLVFAKGANSPNIPACREEAFVFGLSSSALVRWTTALAPGAIVCYGSDSLVCDTARCSIGFTKLPSDGKCACKYRITVTNPSPVDHIVISSSAPPSQITDVSTSLFIPPDNWTLGWAMPSAVAMLNGGLPIPAGTTRAVDVCISASGWYVVRTMNGNAVVCIDSAYLACDTCRCEIQATREPSGPNCACLYKLRFRSPAIVNRVEVVSNTPGVQIIWATMAGWSTTPPLPGNLVTFYGGTPIPACEWRELSLCISGSGSFTVRTWNGNQIVCTFDLALACDTCVCDGFLQPISVPAVTPPIDPKACCFTLWTLNPKDVSMIKLAIMNPGSGAQFVYASMPGWLSSALPAASVTLTGNNQPFLPACRWGAVSFCLTTTGTTPVQLQWETFDASGARVCMRDTTIDCLHDTVDCCDLRHWPRDVVIQSTVYRVPLGNVPPRVGFSISAFSARPVTRFSVITERAWLTTSATSTTHRDVTGYYLRAKGNAIGAPWIWPLLPQPTVYTSPIQGAFTTQLVSLGTYAPMGTPVWNHGGPREIKWNNEGLSGYDCTTGPRCILNPAVNGIRYEFAWQPTEMPVAKRLYLHYIFRFEFTDTTCITCWVIREGVVPLQTFIPVPWPGPAGALLEEEPPADTGGDALAAGAADGEAAHITMSDRNNGELQVSVPQMSDSLNAFRVVAVMLEPEAAVPIVSMRDKTTSASATIANGRATIAADIGELEHATYALQYDNSANRSSFRNVVTLAGVFADDPTDTLFVTDTLTARVPPGPGDARDSIGIVTTGRPTAVHTYAVYFANANAGQAGVARVVLTPKQNAAIIAVGPTEDTTQVAMDGYALEGGRVVLLPAIPPGAAPGPVAPGTQLRPIYLTVSGSANGEALIGFATIDENGDTVSTGTVTLRSPITTGLRGDEPDAALPGAMSLAPCFPNPASASATIQFTLRDARASATLTVTDAAGREVARLLDRALLQPGEHAVVFSTGSLPAGTYYYTLASGTATRTRSFVILR